MNPKEKIGPTAWGIASRRAGCDIPYAKEIFDELAKLLTAEDRATMEKLLSEKDQALTPQFEARYKLLNRLLKQTGIKQVLELAAGIAPRGMDMTDDPTVTYVEMDLPGIIQQKETILNAVVANGASSRANLYLEPGSALLEKDIGRATAHFNAQHPVAVIHEGLMRYLTFDQKEQVARHVKELLETFGGIYITPDITLKVFIDERVRTAVSQIVGMDINANAFENVEEAEKFFDSLGFVIEKHPFAEIKSELVSPKRLHLSEAQVGQAINTPVFFVMRLK